MAQMAGGRIPSNISIRDFTIDQIANDHQIQHGLNAIPETFMILPKIKPSTTSSNNPYSIIGFSIGGSGLTNYPYKIISCYSAANNTWDYTGSNQGFTADETNINIRFNTANRFPVGDYTLIAYTYD